MANNKLIATACLLVVVVTTMASDQLSIYASATTEDDGWVEGEDDSQGEISSQEELEEAYEGTEWEDNIGPNEFEEATNNDDDEDEDDDDNNDDIPYCDEVDDGYTGSCFDRYDYSDTTGLYPCKDGSQVSNPQECESTSNVQTTLNQLGGIESCLYDTTLPQCAPANCECRDGYGMNEDGRCFPDHSKCPDGYHGHEDDESGECIPNNIPCSQGYIMTVMRNGGDNCEQIQKQISCIDVPFYLTCDSQKNRNDNEGDKTNIIEKTTVVQSPSTGATVTPNQVDISNCKLDGSTDGIQQKFNTIRYQACGLYINADKAYYDGFMAGCMQVGNTKIICETVADSSVSNMRTLQAQTPTTTQPIEAIQPAQ